MKEPIYLDGAASAPLSKAAYKAMKPFMSKSYVGNSKGVYDQGIRSHIAIEQARKDIAEILDVTPSEVFFTSGATEGNNWVIKMIALKELRKPIQDRKRIMCCVSEHASVLNCCKQVEEWGMQVVYVPLDSKGRCSKRNIQTLINNTYCLVCMMAVNNELGKANDIYALTREISLYNIPLLVDCTQQLAYGKGHLKLKKLFPAGTYFTFSSHKIYGPTGVGCLIMRDTDPKFRLDPLIIGGSQEQGLRAGTSNTAGIVGMAAALKELSKVDYRPIFEELATYTRDLLHRELPLININTWPDHCNIMSLNCSAYFNTDSLAVILGNMGIAAVSAGSACDATHIEAEGDFNPSHVLVAIGLTEKEIKNTIRISFTRYTTKKDIDRFVKELKNLSRGF